MIGAATSERKQQKRGGKTVRRVLDASLDLIAEGGFDAVQLAAVSKKSGVSTGSLYHHFGSKAGIITRLVEEFTSKAVADLKNLDMTGQSFESRLRGLLNLTCAQFRNNPELYQAMAQRVRVDPGIWEPLRALRVKFEARMMEEFQDDLHQRRISDPKQAIRRMLQSILGILTHSILFDSGPVRPSAANLETQVFAIGRAVLLLPDQQEPPYDA